MTSEEAQARRGRDFEITVVATPQSGQVCAKLKGELDISTVSAAKDRIGELTHKGRDLILDLRELSFIDSSGLNLVLQVAADSTRDGWCLSLIPGSRVIQRVFHITGTQECLPFKGAPENSSSQRESSSRRGRWLRP
jgi:anti-anti-sigma factor